MGRTYGSKKGVRMKHKKLDWNSETVKIALAKAKAAYEAAEIGNKMQALEKVFAMHMGTFRSYYTIVKHMEGLK